MSKNEIIQRIINVMDNGKIIAIEELAYLVNVSTSTIKRYKKIINKSADFTILSISGRNGGYYIKYKNDTLKE